MQWKLNDIEIKRDKVSHEDLLFELPPPPNKSYPMQKEHNQA